MNPRIEIVSASAGSGKTYRLAQTLLASLESGEARPEAVVAVTFTRKAAGELAERARRFLIENGRSGEAHRLSAARIGTVHEVGARLIAEHAFDLGLSPRQEVLDEGAAREALGHSLAGIVEARSRVFADLKSRLGWQWDWERDVDTILQRARANDMGPDALAASGVASRAVIGELLPATGEAAGAMDGRLLAALDSFLAASPATDTTKGTATIRDLARRLAGRLRAGRALDWNDWLGLANKSPTKRSREAWEPVLEVARDVLRHPRLREDLETAAGLVLEVAGEVLAAYAEFKRERGLVDFPDQLALARELLRRPEVRDRLRGDIDLVLVDEFQDTSPIQLAIFVELARLARRSVWVGDQKQAIYGFLDADPALMDAAMEAVLGDEEPDILRTSYRSRPGLVELTSDLFTPAFRRVGIPEERTRLEPWIRDEPAGLGPCVERWSLEGSKAPERAAALAAGMAELLAPGSGVEVRDRESGAARTATASDVAVLCRSNAGCERVAGALRRSGIPATVAETGLCSTPEARLVLAGLARWRDSRDSLAAAELARWTRHPGDDEAWLEAALREPHAAELERAPAVRSVDEARRGRPDAGLLEAFDAVVEAVGARERCLAWGDAAQRTANLDALRAQVCRYLGTRSAREDTVSLPGLLGWLAGLEGSDPRAAAGDGPAVTVITWHRAKGLEWPIAVLDGFSSERRDSAFGVHVVRPGPGFDFDDPLAGATIRYVPYPFKTTVNPLVAAMAAHPATAELGRRMEREGLRLLYVGWTRARDRVVLAGRPGKLTDDLAVLRDEESCLFSEPAGETVWAGRRVEVEVRTLTAAEPPVPETKPGEGYAAVGRREHSPARLPASGVEGTGRVGDPVRLGERLALTGSPDMEGIGEAVHGFLAADRAGLDGAERLAIASGLLERWGVAESVEASEVLRAGDALRTWVEERWPGATWRREWPLARRLPAGTVVHGRADLVLETGDGLVLIDHKTFPGGVEQARERAASFGGQLAAYAAALEAVTGRELAGAFIHLAVGGVVFPVVPVAAAVSGAVEDTGADQASS